MKNALIAGMYELLTILGVAYLTHSLITSLLSGFIVFIILVVLMEKVR